MREAIRSTKAFLMPADYQQNVTTLGLFIQNSGNVKYWFDLPFRL